MPKPMTPVLCRHCRRKKVSRPRGLCRSCYYRPGVRDMYPSTSKFAPHQKHHDPTEEELDQMVREQMPTMPPWGHDDE